MREKSGFKYQILKTGPGTLIDRKKIGLFQKFQDKYK